MKQKILGIITGTMLLAGGAVYAFGSQAEDCPLQGTPDCPLVQDCPQKGQPDCPLVTSATALPECCLKK